MAKKNEEAGMNLYYMNGQAEKETIENLMQRKKAKEREKRIKQNSKHQEDDFDIDTEMVIGMTNRNNQKKQEAKKVKISKQQRKREKRRKKIKFFLKLFIIMGIIIGAIIFAICSPIFNIKDIEVINNNHVSSENIISLSGLTTEQNIFRYISSHVESQIKENPYIEEVAIHRMLPNKLQIDVKERTPKFSVPVLGNYAYINSQGYFLEITQNQMNLPIISGISTNEEEITPGNRLGKEDLEKLEIVLKIMNIAKDNQIDTKVTSLDIADKNDYIIRIEEDKKTVHLGDSSNLNNKVLYMLSIMEQEKGKDGTIYVNGDFNKKFQPYFRESVKAE